MGSERDAAGAEAQVLVNESEPTQAELAPRHGADPEGLLDGEDPDTLQVHDADHWIRVYRDLLEFKPRLLARAREMVPKMDVAAMDAEARKLQRRLEYWQARRLELSGAP